MAAGERPGALARVGAVTARADDPFPEVSLPATSGRHVNLAAEARGQHLVLFFYPGDREGLRFPELSGCTSEACSFRDHTSEVRALGASIFGVSTGSTARQRTFAQREQLNFELLSDDRLRLTNALGIPLWRSADGEQFVARTTFVVRRGGRIAKIFEDVSLPGHLDEVLAAVASLPR